MRFVIFVSCLLMTSLLSQSQTNWVPETGKVTYMGGNVGIGTTTPEGKLQVEGGGVILNGDVRMVQHNDVGYGRTIWFGTAATNTDPFVLGRYNVAADQSELRLFLGDEGGDRFNIGYATGPGALATKVSIVASGQMSIGGAYIPAGYRLAVEGNIIAEKVRVQLRSSWPDYVFDPAYQLPSLNKVEQFIRQHKHLPEVPSAKEVEKDGLELGDNQALLLKKIEELTLYLIQQNNKLEEQNKRIKKLEAANEQLRLEKQVIKANPKK